MGGVARSELVAAVSEAGGFGFLGMVREPPALIRREVDALRRRGIERFGVNIIPAATDRLLLDQQVDTLLELDVPVPVINESVMQLAESRDGQRNAARAIAMMRRGFGGHPYGRSRRLQLERRTSRLGGFTWPGRHKK